MTERTVLSARLQASRRLKGLTQQQLAQRAALSMQTIARIEQGRTTQILTGALERLSQILEVSTDYLLGLDDDPRPRRRRVDPETDELMAVPYV